VRSGHTSMTGVCLDPKCGCMKFVPALEIHPK
jgi:hypothetical protein